MLCRGHTELHLSPGILLALVWFIILSVQSLNLLLKPFELCLNLFLYIHSVAYTYACRYRDIFTARYVISKLILVIKIGIQESVLTLGQATKEGGII